MRISSSYSNFTFIKSIIKLFINKRITALLLFIFFSSAFSFGANDWELKRENDGVKVYARSVDGSNINEIKAIFTLKTSLNALMALLSDVPGFKDWVYRCGEVYELNRPNVKENYYYQKTLVPWPVYDRDLIIYSQWKQDAVTKVIQIHGKGMPDYIPGKDGVVRVRNFSNYWKLTPLPKGLIQVEYQVSIDPAGIIPAWLVNLTITEGPYQTCISIKNAIKNPKYQLSKGVVLEP